MTDVARVVSLAPSTTATLRALNATDCLVGATEYATSADDSWHTVGKWLSPDYDRINRLDPDLIFTCDPLQAEIRDELRTREYTVHHIEPTTLPDVIDSFATIGYRVGATETATTLTAMAKHRLGRVKTFVQKQSERPTVYCEEWPYPPMAAGNWVPHIVEAAGGRYPYVTPGARSREITSDELTTNPPDHVILHYCGEERDIDRPDPDERAWPDDATVTVVDDRYLNQPSPWLIEGIERMAAVLHDYRPPDGSLVGGV